MSKQWMPPEQWQQVRQGIGCMFCEDIALAENLHSFLVAELRQSYVRLPKNQFMRGWTVVALKRHANELFELSEQELREFWQDVAQVAQALYTIYAPAKINYCIFGNLCPHIHCHLLLQSYGDDPTKPVNMHEHHVLLSAEDYRQMVSRLRETIGQ